MKKLAIFLGIAALSSLSVFGLKALNIKYQNGPGVTVNWNSCEIRYDTATPVTLNKNSQNVFVFTNTFQTIKRVSFTGPGGMTTSWEGGELAQNLFMNKTEITFNVTKGTQPNQYFVGPGENRRTIKLQ